MSYHSWLRHSWYDKFTCAPAKALQKLSPSRKTTFFLLKVTQSRKQIIVSSILPKKTQKKMTILSSWVFLKDKMLRIVIFCLFLEKLRTPSIALEIFWPLDTFCPLETKVLNIDWSAYFLIECFFLLCRLSRRAAKKIKVNRKKEKLSSLDGSTEYL